MRLSFDSVGEIRRLTNFLNDLGLDSGGRGGAMLLNLLADAGIYRAYGTAITYNDRAVLIAEQWGEEPIAQEFLRQAGGHMLSNETEGWLRIAGGGPRVVNSRWGPRSNCLDAELSAMVYVTHKMSGERPILLPGNLQRTLAYVIESYPSRRRTAIAPSFGKVEFVKIRTIRDSDPAPAVQMLREYLETGASMAQYLEEQRRLQAVVEGSAQPL